MLRLAWRLPSMTQNWNDVCFRVHGKEMVFLYFSKMVMNSVSVLYLFLNRKPHVSQPSWWQWEALRSFMMRNLSGLAFWGKISTFVVCLYYKCLYMSKYLYLVFSPYPQIALPLLGDIGALFKVFYCRVRNCVLIPRKKSERKYLPEVELAWTKIPFFFLMVEHLSDRKRNMDPSVSCAIGTNPLTLFFTGLLYWDWRGGGPGRREEWVVLRWAVSSEVSG